MEQQFYTEVLVYAKKCYHQITELISLTEQLAEAVDRDDQVSVRMLISMREEPIYKLRETEALFHDTLLEWPAEEAAAARRILEGGAPETAQEQAMTDAIAANRRGLVRLIELDQRNSRKLAGEKSFYASQKPKE